MKYFKTLLITVAILIFAVSGAAYAQDDGESHTIGIIVLNSQLESTAYTFLTEMAELGYIEDDIDNLLAELAETGYVEQEKDTFIYDMQLAEDVERLPEVIQSMIDAEVDVIFTPTQQEAVFVKTLNDEVPIVFGIGADPVGVGLVESLTEPGGNVTGIAAVGYNGRRMQLLAEIDPTIERVYYAYDPTKSASVNALEEIEVVAESLDIEIVAQETRNLEDVLEAIENIPEDIDAIFISTDVMMYDPLAWSGWVTASMRLKAGISIAAYADFPGILMGYGPDITANAAQAARLVDQILRGADPADIPVENAEYALIINLETAMALEIDIPRGVLRQADAIVRPDDE